MKRGWRTAEEGRMVRGGSSAVECHAYPKCIMVRWFMSMMSMRGDRRWTMDAAATRAGRAPLIHSMLATACDRRNKFAAVATNLRQLATGVKNSNYEKRESLGRDIFRSVFLRNFEEHIFLKAGVRSDIKRLNDVFLLFC